MFSYPLHLFRNESMNSYIRVLHASPKSPAVDIYINDKPTITNLSYRHFSEYLPITAGTYNIAVYPTGKKDTPVLTTSFSIPPNEIFTIAAIGTRPSDLSLLPLSEPQLEEPETGETYVRFAHLSPNAPAVDIAVPNGKVLFDDVSYKEYTDYIAVPNGTYTLEALLTGTDTPVLYVPNIKLKPRRFYTVYAVGLVGDNPPLQVLIPLDGNSYLEF